MILHFIFLIYESDVEKRTTEFSYIKKMSKFFQKWIQEKFSKKLEVKCDIMTTKRRSIFQKLDIPTLVRDHNERDPKVFHFYLSPFRPIWTDCTCEGYHAENFGMIWWRPIDEKVSDTLQHMEEKKLCFGFP